MDAAPTARGTAEGGCPHTSEDVSDKSLRPTRVVVPSALRIGAVTIAPATVLAPMAGVTDTVFRRFIRNLGGCGLIMTEFTSAHGVKAALRSDKTKKTNRTLQRYLAF